MTTLQRQVTALQRQVRTLRTQTNELREFAGAIVAVNACVLAITADAVQGTWTTVNQSEGRTLFPAAQTLNDRGACSALRVQRQPTLVPPVISPFSSLLILLTGQSAALPPR